MFKLSSSVFLCLAVCTQHAASQVGIPSGITDQGFPDFRQLIDVNNDTYPDYCRFVGTSPNIFLSCQLGKKRGGFDPAPYAFSAPIGTDLGTGPHLIFPVGGVQPGFCRYLDRIYVGPIRIDPSASTGDTLSSTTTAVIHDPGATVNPSASAVVHDPTTPTVAASSTVIRDTTAPSVADGTPIHKRPEPPIPALDNTKKLSCIQATKTGFDSSKEVDPDDRADHYKTALVEGKDGNTIELVYGGKGAWIASTTDSTGRQFQLSGFTTLSDHDLYYTNYLKLTSDRDESGKLWNPDYLKKNPRANIVVDQFLQLGKNHSVNYSISAPGTVGYSTLTTGSTAGSQVFVWDGCLPANPASPSVGYYGITQTDGSIKWQGPPAPQSYSSCIPNSFAKIQNFSQVFDVLSRRSKDVIHTGNASVDDKDFASLNSSDLQVIINTLNDKIAQSGNPDQKKQLLDVIKFLNAMQVFVNGAAVAVGGNALYGVGLALAAGTAAGPALLVMIATEDLWIGSTLVIQGALEYQNNQTNKAVNDCIKEAMDKGDGTMSDSCTKLLMQ